MVVVLGAFGLGQEARAMVLMVSGKVVWVLSNTECPPPSAGPPWEGGSQCLPLSPLDLPPQQSQVLWGVGGWGGEEAVNRCQPLNACFSGFLKVLGAASSPATHWPSNWGQEAGCL